MTRTHKIKLSPGDIVVPAFPCSRYVCEVVLVISVVDEQGGDDKTVYLLVVENDYVKLLIDDYVIYANAVADYNYAVVSPKKKKR